MDWTVVREPGMLMTSGDLITIRGSGVIVEGDAEALRETLLELLDKAAAAGEPAPVPLIELQSPGGSVGAGIEIGYVLRAFALPVHVPVGSGCHSACTLAFLGGVERTVVGPFGVHAMTPATELVEDLGLSWIDLLKDTQGASSFLISYARDMIGRPDLVEAALQIPTADTAEVDDAHLRDWDVITEALRPSQRLPDQGVMARCADSAWLAENVAPRYLICNELAVARQYAEIAQMVEALRGRPFAPNIDTRQARFEAAIEGCTAPADMPLSAWTAHNRECVTAAVAARWQELDGLARYYEAHDSESAKAWR